jgi:hypothetical protein
MHSVLHLTIAAFALALIAPLPTCAEPVRIIFDTDMDSDCDDVAALAMLHALADARECHILGTMVSSKHPWAGPCTDAINTFYGRPDLPIGVPRGAGPKLQASKYAETLAREFPRDLPEGDRAPDAVREYRRILQAEQDGAAAIVTIGDLTNLRHLLESGPDDLSSLAGHELVRRKVRHWVCMGSRYPADLDPAQWGNFKMDPASTVRSVQGWPGLITFTGGGEFAEHLKTGAKLQELPTNHIVRRGYELYFGGRCKDRHSADQIAVLVAVRGTAGPWELVRMGYNHIFPDGTHEWRAAPDKANHQYISALHAAANPFQVREAIANLMGYTPHSPRGKP